MSPRKAYTVTFNARGTVRVIARTPLEALYDALARLDLDAPPLRFTYLGTDWLGSYTPLNDLFATVARAPRAPRRLPTV